MASKGQLALAFGRVGGFAVQPVDLPQVGNRQLATTWGYLVFHRLFTFNSHQWRLG